MNSNEEALLMAKEISRFIAERRGKKELALLKEKPKKEKGGINTRLERLAGKLLSDPDEQLTLTALKKGKKNKTQTALEFQQSKYQAIMTLLDGYKVDDRVVEISNEYKEALLIINQRHRTNVWLNQWSEKAKDISFATHVAKLTHSSSKGSSILDRTTSLNPSYLTTNSITELAVDTAANNAASAPAGEVLTLQINGKSLLDYVRNGDSAPFEHLTESREEIDKWMLGFKQAYESNEKNSYFLSKQVYFPIENDQYHLLMPLVSSALAHTLFLKFKEYFDDKNTFIRKQKDENKYHEKPAISYPNRASLNVTGSNPSNASSLNGKRGGRLTLLANYPPKWTQKQRPPKQLNNLFNRSLSYKLHEEIKDLKRLLLVIKSRQISMKKPEMYRATVNAVHAIADRFFDELILINLLGDEIGWTKSTQLPLSQQLLLEPTREDDVAMQEKLKKQWQNQAVEDFAFWLNKQLKHKKLILTPISEQLWRDIFKEPLRTFIATQEVGL